MEYGGLSIALSDLPRWGGESDIVGSYRARPSDFVVEEVLGYSPSGEGPHHWVWVEKIGVSTDDVAKQLAEAWSVSRKDVGYAGKKDTQAIARQWFSVPESAQPMPGPITEQIQVLEVSANPRKLKIGQLAGNRFQLRVILSASDGLADRLTRIQTEGVPNYFGDQRFGRSGHNLAAARRLAARDPEGRRRLHPKDGMAASAARSALFNRIVAARVASRRWLDVAAGDTLMLAGRNSHFQAKPDELEELLGRVLSTELNPTAPMWGRRSLTGETQATEEARVADLDSQLSTWLAGVFPVEERRAARVVPTELEWVLEGTTLVLSFGLPRGSYATAVLHELGTIVEAHARPSA